MADLSDTSKVKLAQALADKSVADNKAAADSAAAEALTAAQDAKVGTAADSLAAHTTATASAHDFILSAATDLGFTLPTDF